MIIRTKEGTFDTDTDLTAPERHILQKLLLWEAMAESLEEFRKRKEEAFLKGWNNSGPVPKGPAMSSIIRELERKVGKRLQTR